MDNDNPRAWLPLHLASLSFAEDMLGVKEDRIDGEWSNWGPQIKEFLASADIHAPAAWCAAFAYWAINEAAELKGMEHPLKEVGRKAYVPDYVTWARNKNRIISVEDAGPGDLFALNFPSKGRYAHLGFVVEVNEDEGWFTTCEGNSNEEGSREGYMVVSRRRSITRNVRFLRYD